MTSANSNLNIILSLKDQASSGLKKFTSNLDASSGNLKRVSNGLTEVDTNAGILSAGISRLGGVVAGATVALGAMAVAGATLGLKMGIDTARQLETAEIGLKTLLGSADKARETVNRLKEEAKRTPFELAGLTQATQLLSSVTKDGNKSIDILLDIGEALSAMGKGQAELDRIIVNLQQIASVGKASMLDIKQFAFAGIPIFEMLEQHFAKATTSVVNNSTAITKNNAELKKLQQQLEVATQRQKDFTKNTSDATKLATKFKIEELRGKIAGLSKEIGGLSSANGSVVSSVKSVEDAIQNGEVTFELLTEMFQQATDEGGRFFGAFQNQSGSFNQALSNMKDSINIFFADLAIKSGLMRALTDSMIKISEVFSNFNLSDVQQRFASFFEYINEKTGIIDLLRWAWESVSTQFRESLLPAIMQLWVALQPYRPYLEALAQILGAGLVIAIYTAVGALTVITKTLIFLFTWLTKIASFISGTFVSVFQGLQLIIEAVASGIERVIKLAERAISLVKKVGLGKSKETKVNDAIIAPNGNIISTHPDDYLIATKNPASLAGGGTMNLTITGNTFMGEDDVAEKVGNQIMRVMKLNTKFN